MTDADSPSRAAASAGDRNQSRAFPVWETTVTSERQLLYHRACDVDTERFAGRVDPSVLANDCARSFVKAKLPVEGLLLNYHKIDQIRPVELGEVLDVHGRIQKIAKSDRGTLVTTAFDFINRGERVIGMESIALRPEARLMRQGRAEDEGAKTGRPAGYELVGRKLLTPERVQAYAKESANKVHFDAGFAARFEFRSPVAHGLMQLTYVIGLVAQRRLPDAFEVDARFLSPLYWDDGLDIVARTMNEMTDYKLVNARGHVVCESEFRG